MEGELGDEGWVRSNVLVEGEKSQKLVGEPIVMGSSVDMIVLGSLDRYLRECESRNRRRRSSKEC